MMKDKIKRYSWPVAVIVLVSVSLYAGFYISTATAFPQNPSTYEYFNKIADAPYVRHSFIVDINYYWQYGGDCDDRAFYFREYLKKKGETNIHTMTVQRVVEGSIVKPFNDTQGHTFILWNGRVYDPQNNRTKRFYDEDLEEYLAYLKVEYGYNTLYYLNGTSVSF